MTDSPLQFLLEAARKTPAAPVMIFPDARYDYQTLLGKVERRAAHLQACGVGPGVKVAIYSEPDLDTLTSFFAIWGLGGVAIPMNVTLPPASLRQIEGVFAPDLGLASDPGAPYAPTDIPVHPITDGDTGIALNAANRDGLAIVMFTSGTSGVPKAVPITHAMIAANASSTAERLGLSAHDRILINTPAYTTSSIIHTLTMMSAGASVVIDRQFSLGGTLLDQIKAYSCTGFGGVPVHFRRLLAALETATDHAPTLRFLMNSGEHLPVPVVEGLRAFLPEVAIFCVYGLTEVAGRLCILPAERLADKLGSVGFPLDGMTVTVRDSQGQELPPGESGEVFVTGANLMAGYLNNPTANAKSMTANGFATGDIGYKDEDGFLYLLGRDDDIFKVGGEKVSLNMIEQAVTGYAAFKDFAAAPYTDPHMGSVPALYYVLADDAPTDWRKTLLKKLRGSLPKTHIPAHLIAVEAIPRTSSGKAVRKALAAHTA